MNHHTVPLRTQVLPLAKLALEAQAFSDLKR